MFPLNIKLLVILLAVMFALYTFSKKYTIVRKVEKKPVVSKKAPAPAPAPAPETESDDEEEKES
jgi:hypothetical protein